MTSTDHRAAEHLPGNLDVIVPDLLGFGASDRLAALDDLWAPGQATVLGELLDELDTGPVTVVGHDFGGPVALALTAQQPEAVAAIGLLAANTFTDTPIPFPWPP